MTGRRSPKRQPARRSLVSRATILREAGELAIAELSSERIARRMHVSERVIRYHFKTAQELIAARLNAILSDIELPSQCHWSIWLKEVALALRGALRSHPGSAAHVSLGSGRIARETEIAEKALQLLSMEMDREQAWLAYRSVMSYALWSVEAAQTNSSPPPALDMPRDSDEHFIFGLDAMLRGIGTGMPFETIRMRASEQAHK